MAFIRRSKFSFSLAFAFALALAGMLIAAAATCCEAKEKKTQEEKDFEAARKAYKDLFVYSGSQSVGKVLEKLDALTKVYGRSDLDMPLDYHMLISFNQTMEAKCDSYEYVKKLKETYELVESQYKALRKYMNDCLDRQLKMCNFEQRFRDKFDEFKANSPGQWEMIREFNAQAGDLGKLDSDWQSEALDNSYQMNEALTRMARKHNQPGMGGDPARNAYQMTVGLRSACGQFDDRLAAGLLMLTIDERRVKKNKEVKEWNRLMKTCRAVGRVNFEPALGDIFGHTYYPEAQRAWDWYANWREGWI